MDKKERQNKTSFKLKLSVLAIAVGLAAGSYCYLNPENKTLDNKPDPLIDPYTPASVEKMELNTTISEFKTTATDAVMLSKSVRDTSYNIDPAPTTDAEIKSHGVMLVKDNPISTFSADTDDGAYKLFKANINKGSLLDEDFIRAEEFINAFQYDYKNPTNTSDPFSAEIKITPSPWSDNHLLLIGIKGYEYTLHALPPINLTFLVDVSGSMSNEIPVIQAGINMLVNKLRPEDSISIVTYAGSTSLVLPNTKVSEKDNILSAITQLKSGGSTNGSAGIKLAYNENARNFNENGINRVILMSDGDFNVGLSSLSALEEMIKEKRKSGTTFSTVGIGGSNYQDQQMEQMANKGNGNYTFLGDMNDAREVFADRFIPTLKSVAKDVKYQLEFNKTNVKEYRLIGYENRALKTEDFNNDNIDAGELPSGSTTTAIYEITLSDQKGIYPESRYEKDDIDTTPNELADELGHLKIRFKQPNDDISSVLEFNIDKSLIDSEVNDDNVFAINVAGFTQVYRNSDFISHSYTYDTVIENLTDIELDGKKQEFINMVKTTRELKAIATPNN